MKDNSTFLTIFRLFPRISEQLICDARRYHVAKPGLISLVKLSLVNPGFRAVIYIRLIAASKDTIAAKLLRVRALRNLAIDISPGCQIGSGLRIDHPVGIVIGKKVKIGNNVTISQQVTIGEKYNDSRSRGEYPSLGSNISIGAGSIIIGKIKVGSDSTIGAHSLILSDVRERSTVYGLHK